MKKIAMTIALLMGAAMTAHAGGTTAIVLPETVNFDGCEGRLVPGTNYYNDVVPGCKGQMDLYDETGAEARKREAAEAAS